MSSNKPDTLGSLVAVPVIILAWIIYGFGRSLELLGYWPKKIAVKMQDSVDDWCERRKHRFAAEERDYR